jgi:hypothetical protein
MSSLLCLNDGLQGKGAKGAKEEEELSPIEAVLTLPPEPEPEEEAEVAAKPEGLTPALGKLLHAQWEELEGNYLKGLSLLFASLREERTETVDHFVGVRKVRVKLIMSSIFTK